MKVDKVMPANSPEVQACRFVGAGMRAVGYTPPDPSAGTRGTWRTSPKPLELPPETVQWLHELGAHLHQFNLACDRLYRESAAGREPNWVARYIDQGKPDNLIRYSRMAQFTHTFPTIIRPDIIPTRDGMLITELDAVPGGMGVTGRMAELYTTLSYQLVGKSSVAGAFASMIRAAAKDTCPRLAIVVSEESAAYRPEMTWLAQALAEFGVEARVASPYELVFSSTGVAVMEPTGDFEVEVIYRFFELFDLPNIRGSEQLMRLNAEGRIRVVPPFRPLFEEKMWMALFHHPALTDWWRNVLGCAVFEFLSHCFPKSWILEPEPVPPHATTKGLTVAGSAVSSWKQLENLGRSRRKFIIKPSGFSEKAWGGRGVVVGHDISTREWNLALRAAIEQFGRSPHVLQEFRSGIQFDTSYLDSATGSVAPMRARARLCPFYFVSSTEVTLSSVMATLCPLDKKKLHGMSDAVIVPCAVKHGSSVAAAS